MLDRLRDYVYFVKTHLNTSNLSRLIIVVAIAIIIMLSFYWNFGFQDTEVKSIPTEGGRAVSVFINAEFFLALIVVFLFFLGYRVYIAEKRGRADKFQVFESRNEVIVKYLLSIVLGVIGAWVIYIEFSREFFTSYAIQAYVNLSRNVTINETNIPVSLVLTVIAFLLLLNWYIIGKVRVSLKPKAEANE